MNNKNNRRCKAGAVRGFHSLAAVLVCLAKAQAYEINVFTDTLAAGWAYMDSCITFEIQLDSVCKVSWTVTKMKKEYDNEDEKLTLSSRPYSYRPLSQCSLSFSLAKEPNKQILDTIFLRWPASRFKSVSYFSFRHGNDYSWNIPIAIASAKSPKYADYRKNYPNTKHSANDLFVAFANETKAYKNLADLFEVHALALTLISVEKVFTGKVEELAFGKQLREAELQPEDRVIWDAGMSYFSLDDISNQEK